MRKLNNSELKRITVEEFKKTNKNQVVIILDNVRSAQNVGSIFRTSDAFLIEKIYLCGITPKPPSNEIRKTALGATNSVDWEYHNNTKNVVRLLKNKGYNIVGVEQAEKSTSLYNFKINKPTALIFGHEVEGIDQDIINDCDKVLEIEQYGTKHSLNISVCAGIVIWKVIKSI
tara:strand:+ start:380 stop:898 length:519 start_codon:yes stop_codon:yes gene_type:complete